MSDGRHFTDYRTRCSQTQSWRQDLNFPSSYDFRMYLTRNADKLIEQNSMRAVEDNACVPCYATSEAGTMLPEQYMMQCSDRSCSFKVNDPQGLGLGRNYSAPGQKHELPGGNLKVYPINGIAETGYDNYGKPL
jgi:hypothetical protein